jgi:hypothetical protein
MSKISLGLHIEHRWSSFCFWNELSLFFQLKMSIDESHKGIFFSCPILPKDPLGFFDVMMMKSTWKHVSPPLSPLRNWLVVKSSPRINVGSWIVGL